MGKSEFGVIGLGVMGKSLSLNIAEKGFRVSVYNRNEGDEAQVVSEFLKHNASFKTITGFTNLKEFVTSLEQPRKILIMVKAGTVVDAVIAHVVPFLSKEDILIDGGNSHFTDTQKRFESLKQQHIHFIGCGISGGEEGARKGPSLMPGGTLESYEMVAPILKAIAAKDVSGQPCCAFIGNDGSGHFVKMIHNGMEYAEMQLLAEVYALMSKTMDNEAIAKVFSTWNKGDLSSYLLEITIDILRKKENGDYLLDKILDKAENKGTGSWSSKTAMDLGVPSTMMTSAVFARYLSSFKSTREKLSKHIQVQNHNKIPLNLKTLEKAYRFARIVNHHQGFEIIDEASKAFHWNLNLSEIARIWTNGCIIRSQLMQDSISFLKKHNDLISHKDVFENLKTSESSIAEVLQLAISNRVPLDTFWAAYTYWISMTTKRLSANLIQAQRDYFGAHTYQRLDKPLAEYFHTNWNAS
jgi:6-phosphogluconate dehydrogenase